MKEHIKAYKDYNNLIYLKSLSEILLYLMNNLSDYLVCLFYFVISCHMIG